MNERRKTTLAQPAVFAAAIAAALVAPVGPGALLALYLLPSLSITVDGFAERRAMTLASMPTESVILGVAVLALIGYVPRLALTLATMQAARGRAVRPLAAIKAQGARILRARRVSLMVGTFTFGLVALIAFNVAEKSLAPPLAYVGVALAAYIATAGLGMMSLADRAMAFDVDGRQDARAAAAREESRHAGPHYLDTSTARAGYDVATSADDATTVAMRAFLTPAPWVVALVALVLDAVPVGVACLTPEVSGLGAAWLSPGASAVLAPLGFVVTLAVIGLRALLEVGQATLWTRAYQRTASSETNEASG